MVNLSKKLRQSLFLCFCSLSLGFCRAESLVGLVSPPSSAEVVDISSLSANPKAYLGKWVTFYVNGVSAYQALKHYDSKGDAQSDGVLIFPDDKRYEEVPQSGAMLSILIPSNHVKDWREARFSRDQDYTITFTGEVVQRKGLCCDFVVRKFSINAAYPNPISDDFSKAPDDMSLKIVGGLPVATMPVPLPLPPMKVADLRDVGLLPEKYTGRKIKFAVKISKGDLFRNVSGSVVARYQQVELDFSSEQAAQLIGDFNADPYATDYVSILIVGDVIGLNKESNFVQIKTEKIAFDK